MTETTDSLKLDMQAMPIIIKYFGFSRFQVLETPYLRHWSSCIA